MTWQPVDDWITLPGAYVEVHCRGQLVDLGTVDSVTHDGNLLWLQQHGADPRRIIHRGPDIFVLRANAEPQIPKLKLHGGSETTENP